MIKFRYKRKDPVASSSPSTTATSSVATVTSANSVVATAVTTATNTLQYLQPASSATLPKSTPRNAINSQTAQVVQHYQQQQYQHCDTNSYNPKVVDAGYYLTNESVYHEMINRMKTESVHQQHYEYMSCINSVVVSFQGPNISTF